MVVFNVHIVHCGGWSPYGVFPSVAGRKIPDAVFVDSGLFPLNALSKTGVNDADEVVSICRISSPSMDREDAVFRACIWEGDNEPDCSSDCVRREGDEHWDAGIPYDGASGMRHD